MLRKYSPTFFSRSEKMISGRRFRTRLAAVMFGLYFFKGNFAGVKKH